MDRPVLVVDGETDLTVSYERLLRRRGYRVVSASSCRAGLLALAGEPFRLVITDLRLPDGDGLEIIRAARALPAGPPVLVATVLGSRETRLAALAAGAAAFLAKPFGAEAFNRLVDEALAARP